MVDTRPGGKTTNSETIFADNKIYVKDATIPREGLYIAIPRYSLSVLATKLMPISD